MNEISFERAPVIELIAELRWTMPGTMANASGQIAAVSFGGGGAEEFFQHFGNEVAKEGFTQSERIVPSGFPLVWHQVVWRFRRPNDRSSLLQVGPGVFTANALQPYRQWSEFRPTVDLGIRALLQTRPESEKAQAFSGVSLRYINGFKRDLLGDRHPSAFIKEVLGFSLALPKALQGLAAPDTQVSGTSNIRIPIANLSKVMSVVVGDGNLNTEPAALLDLTVAEIKSINSDHMEVLQTLESSRDIVHNCFLELTEPIHSSMKPLKS